LSRTFFLYGIGYLAGLGLQVVVIVVLFLFCWLDNAAALAQLGCSLCCGELCLPMVTVIALSGFGEHERRSYRTRDMFSLLYYHRAHLTEYSAILTMAL